MVEVRIMGIEHTMMCSLRGLKMLRIRGAMPVFRVGWPAEDEVLQRVPDIVVHGEDGQSVRYRLNCSNAAFAGWAANTWNPPIDLVPIENRNYVKGGVVPPPAVQRQADININ